LQVAMSAGFNIVILNEAKSLRTRLPAENRKLITYHSVHTYLYIHGNSNQQDR
jgi:hypothetical protein